MQIDFSMMCFFFFSLILSRRFAKKKVEGLEEVMRKEFLPQSSVQTEKEKNRRFARFLNFKRGYR